MASYGKRLFYNQLDRTEIHPEIKHKSQSLLTGFCRDTRIRTWDPLLPKQVRYRTALHPEKSRQFAVNSDLKLYAAY